VHKNIRSGILLNEAVTFPFIKPFHNPFCQSVNLLSKYTLIFKKLRSTLWQRRNFRAIPTRKLCQAIHRASIMPVPEKVKGKWGRAVVVPIIGRYGTRF
jgi:hypothetical protein